MKLSSTLPFVKYKIVAIKIANKQQPVEWSVWLYLASINFKIMSNNWLLINHFRLELEEYATIIIIIGTICHIVLL